MSLQLSNDFSFRAPAPKKLSSLKTQKSTFQKSLEAIYSKQSTEKLVSIFEEKKETYHAQKDFYGDDLVRFKELEMLRILRNELKLRGEAVEIFN